MNVNGIEIPAAPLKSLTVVSSAAPGQSAPSVAVESVRPGALPSADIEALYVHIPFCFHKCHYCDFYSITRQTPERMTRFVDLILREADLWRVVGAPHARIRTVFFGGGTPSLLPLDPMRRLIAGLKERFDLSQADEWTVEVNPATAQPDYCQMLRENGVDRLSLGAQSFNRDELAALERHHDPEDVYRSLEMARAARFSRLNVDLIYAIPGQNLASWARSLDQAIALRTPHISCYNLTYEPNTPMAVRKRLGHFTAVEEDAELEMFHHARQRLICSGHGAYEISNYAMPGEACRHNLIYWTGGNYIGLGPSAASHVEGHRWRNRPHLGEWERAVAAGDVPSIDVERLSPARRAGELAMLMLRLASGIDYAGFAARTGLDARAVFADQVGRLVPIGLVNVGQTAITLTEKGLSLADAIAGEFLSDV
ncbi:MAG TPA: radical SAM family heme chaperone HemW [Tepidisphaeraceae bacterium]|nr:radical SAM family heme chaperone HemW [Tepidisphaeraceae bacterium]